MDVNDPTDYATNDNKNDPSNIKVPIINLRLSRANPIWNKRYTDKTCHHRKYLAKPIHESYPFEGSRYTLLVVPCYTTKSDLPYPQQKHLGLYLLTLRGAPRHS